MRLPRVQIGMKGPYILTHPEHGQHICYTPEDVEAHKAIGWVPAEPAPRLLAELAQSVDEDILKMLTERKKPGRKPKVKHGD